MNLSELETAKLAALAEWAAGAGHEINNPLAVISGRAQLLLRTETHPDRRHDLAVIHQQAIRIHEMIADLMLFARPPALRPAPCRLDRLIHQTLTELQPAAALAKVQLTARDPLPPVELSADAEHLAAALRALLDNALEACSGGGVVWIDLQRGAADQPAACTLTVSDNGPGISDSVRPHLFDPFFSGRAAGRGVGMGLAKCWRIVSLHGGRIEVDSPPGGGAKFSLLLPVSQTRGANEDDRANSPRLRSGLE